MKYLLILVGSLLNRVRGGLRIKGKKFPCNKLWFPLYLGLLTCYVTAWSVSGFLTGFIACYVGQQMCGWGAYLGSLTNGAAPAPECEMIDNITMNCRITIDGRVYKLTDYPRTWGFVSMTIRGLLWSFLIGLAIQSIPCMLAGSLMGLCYLIPTVILWHTKYHTDKTAWNIGEWLWGAVLTASILL